MRGLKSLFILLVITTGGLLHGQHIIGLWETFDDETKEKKSVVEIYQEDDSYYGRIIDISNGGKDVICEVCSGDNHDKPIIGLVIIEDLKKDGDKYSGGSILDPESGNVYRCKLELEGDDKLKVRGFLGVALFGRTQFWRRK